ncbi:MAG: hypothetical protein Q8P21_00715 [bacterium]|nr:hypothetical protein [bacterium]
MEIAATTVDEVLGDLKVRGYRSLGANVVCDYKAPEVSGSKYFVHPVAGVMVEKGQDPLRRYAEEILGGRLDPGLLRHRSEWTAVHQAEIFARSMSPLLVVILLEV